MENVPVEPNGLVRVISLDDTAQLLDVLIGVVDVVMVHTIFYRISDVGNLTLIFDALGIECVGWIVTV